MFPTLNEGDILLYDPAAYERDLPQVGDVVVADDPRNGRKIIKRVGYVWADGRVELRGDNPLG
ncbi:MAG: S26 family signal peptidase, partial [Sphaerospermopsis sp. SIO1G2]|nr:S26 family signal peptidase [Sphaerospermopsis sp. SIO1G2]